MQHPRSIRARLITLYVVTLSVLFLCFSTYMYWGFKQYLISALQQALHRRAHQIAATIIADVPQRGEAYIGSEIQARYAPELNQRVIRVTDDAGRVVYASKNAADLSQPPAVTFTPGAAESEQQVQIEDGSLPLQVVALGYRLASGKTYTVEVGAPETDISTALGGLLLMLSLGFPVFLGLTSGGAYLLLGRALQPVDEIVRSAEQITLRNLSQRLPVTQTGDEVERLSLALNRMIQRLDESYQVTSRFTADASHELRTPLTIMRGELEELLQDPGLSSEQTEQVGSILEEVGRLTQIVEGLLAISRLEAGESQMAKEPLDLARLVASTVEQMAPLAEEKSLHLTCNAGASVRVEANHVRLKQVVVNLLDNAINYTPEGGRINVTVKSAGRDAILEVNDTGIGIPAADLSRIFQRFFQSENAQARRARGTGLGLAMVQSIVEAHGGEISVESRENVGSTFRVRLPRLNA